MSNLRRYQASSKIRFPFPPGMTPCITVDLIRYLARACLVCTLLLAPVARALSTDRDQPIHVEADWAEADEIRRTTVYKGAVIITQGSLRINGETVTLYYDENHALIKAEIKGHPAQFRQRPDGQAKEQRAKAEKMEYFSDRDLIVLLGNAHSWQGKRRISADRIEFDTKNSRIKAQNMPVDGKSGVSKKSRVRIVVPSKK
uniref:Lipopolysaccharide export system protein LptA n=1 Tax=Candidatus Kentrum eta TaxID=2126337 RepID=A0A450UKQ5_9GAMM|nr:MAG: lipopolysaccharide transport protein LptA [Candidatus Kentron sp. H]VFJ94025.1 MAG: lipopolysaccharide transport protein LptA [Candidatus Kentron sp. H]VFK00694.1 MAG: lipopolysaccharide transport protein LptA [Candidatus Kentron sp. H]